ncbi:flavin-containing monooxygenase [Gordonia amicalis]|uniref:flavin-containing monooxygenase n=1 Tax=Gordonia amicalis TaxID=89053 RepID=UPI002954D061|nr:NAD(P)/FAD-dependent oxidoreductase [Gordonia amicalis]MDV7075824.1 NAD(P)/FAD-dependent oxidoreductase [Gordonia amicalis]
MGQPSVTIVGAGFGGIAQAIALRRAGFRSVTILERGDDVGGVWRANTYPGAACDVPSPLYSLSTDPNPDWPRRYSEQPDILAYLRRVADTRGLRESIRFGVDVATAEFDDSANRWVLTTTAGEVIETDVLVTAVGQLSQPAVPDIEGRDTFRGPAFHSAEWDHDVDLAGKRVAVIGTGASAIQFVPAIAPVVEQLTVFQRSAAWVVSKPDSVFGPRRRALFRAVPATLGAERLGTWSYFELITFTLRMRTMGALTRLLARRHLRKQVADAGLRAALTPDCEPWCKRLLFSDDYYPALARDNASLVTASIDRIEPDGVRTADGTLHPADVVVYGTGFAATDFLSPMEVRGRAGRSLTDAWVKGARAYLGISTAGFPNLFMMYGPNTNLGSGSIVYMLESQARHITGLVSWLAENPGHAVEVDPAVEDRFNARIQKELDRSVWSRCSSWYRNSSGTVTTNWPGNVSTYRRRTRRVDRADYRLSAPSGPR